MRIYNLFFQQFIQSQLEGKSVGLLELPPTPPNPLLLEISEKLFSCDK